MSAAVMIDPARVSRARICELRAGDLLQVVSRDGRGKYLAGRQPGERLAVELSDNVFFRPNQEGTEAGILFATVRFEVDPSSGQSADEDRPHGSLLLAGGRLALFGWRGKPGTSSWLAIDRDEPLEQSPAGGDLVFTRWRIMWGEEDREVELFSFGTRAVKVTPLGGN